MPLRDPRRHVSGRFPSIDAFIETADRTVSGQKEPVDMMKMSSTGHVKVGERSVMFSYQLFTGEVLMIINKSIKWVAAARALLLALFSIASVQKAIATGPDLSTTIEFTPLFSQRYNLSYFDGSTWITSPVSTQTVQLQPRFRFEESRPYVYNYVIYLQDKSNADSAFYLMISTSDGRCLLHKTSSADNFSNVSLGRVYNITTQYTHLGTTNPLNSNISTVYSVCSREDALALRFFDPITTGIPIGIGQYVLEPGERVAETYILLNTEGILYPN
ncbi:hypothetical protein [Paraburkholderia bryophila]|uniref:Uncharacterized protein n=1 Tax=Paraburkholderia bryophila TaxID=420952 RepID=A0A7Y9W7X3_9BURK|nr:hypothetical protein [Paraburkholderia bryophila]NYH15271.1 hypothetical protein [Paraburkholderia bryophila]